MFFQQPCGLSKGKQLTTVSSLSFLRFCLPFGRCDIPFLSTPPLKSSVSFMILNVTKVTTGLLERKRVKQLFPNMVKIPVVSCVQFRLFGTMILWHSQRVSTVERASIIYWIRIGLLDFPSGLTWILRMLTAHWINTVAVYFSTSSSKQTSNLFHLYLILVL